MRRPWSEYAPWPFVGVAVLLVILVLLTPILLSVGQPGPVVTRAELVVDRLPGANTTRFYVIGYGEGIRYAGIWVGVASNFVWYGSGSVNWSALRWSTYYNASDVVALAFNSSSNPVAVNVTAYYESSTGNAVYAGEIAFYVGPYSSGSAVYSTSSTSGVFVPAPEPVDNSSQPFHIPLASTGAGSLP